MGYDFHLVGAPDRLLPQVRLYLRLQDRYDEVSDRPWDDPERRAAEEALEACPDPRYHRISITSMPTIREVMEGAGMLSTTGSAPGMPDWRGVHELTLDGERFHPDLCYPDEVCTPDQIEYQDALDRQCRFRVAGTVGIQWWKLTYNDYSIVTADECAEALRAWHSLEPRRRSELLDEGSRMHKAHIEMVPEVWGDLVAAIIETMEGEQSGPIVVESGEAAGGAGGLVSRWMSWLAFLELGAEGDGFMVE